MTLVPSKLTLAGTSIDLHEVLADVTVRHGRADVMDDPTPSTCQVTILDVGHSFVKAFQIRQPLVFSARNFDPPLNLCLNGGFEVDTTGWAASVSTIARDVSRAHAGAASLQVVPSGGLGSAAYNFSAASGTSITVSAWLWLDVGHTVRISTQLVASGGFAGTGAWQKISWTRQITSDNVIAFQHSGGAVGRPFWLDEVRIDAAVPTVEAARFTGTITDAALAGDDLTAMAVGPLASFDQYPIGASDWPAETWSARVSRCFSEAGLASLLVLQAPAFNPLLVERTAATAGPTTLRDYLGFLAPMVGAAVVDRPDGKVLVQGIGARTIAAATRLDPALVEYVPAWVQDLPHGNVVTVRYTGDQSQSVTAQDDASIAIYGRRPVTIDTTFQNVADATQRANERLGRTAFSHWNMPSAPVIGGLNLAIGTPVQIDTFPASAPFDPWQPILEGWTDHITGPDWTMELALSDPLASGLSLPWNAVPTVAPFTWNAINQTVAWKDALTLETLTP